MHREVGLFLDAALVTFGLARTYPSSGGGVRAISFRVRPGEIVGVLGAAGSGKSTLIKVLATRLRAEHGSFFVMGHRVPSYRWSEGSVIEVRRRIGVLLDESPHCSDLTGRENMRLHARLHRIPRAEAERRTAILFDLTGMRSRADHPVRRWSYAERRKLALSQALLHKPPVLLLDEPEHGLDIGMRATLRAVIADVAAEGAAVVMATSEPASVASLCHTALLMHRGRISASGPADQVLAQLGRGALVTVRLAAPGPLPDLSPVPGLLSSSRDGSGLAVRVEDPDRALAPLVEACIAAGLRVAGLEINRDSLWGVVP